MREFGLLILGVLLGWATAMAFYDITRDPGVMAAFYLIKTAPSLKFARCDGDQEQVTCIWIEDLTTPVK